MNEMKMMNKNGCLLIHVPGVWEPLTCPTLNGEDRLWLSPLAVLVSADSACKVGRNHRTVVLSCTYYPWAILGLLCRLPGSSLGKRALDFYPTWTWGYSALGSLSPSWWALLPSIRPGFHRVTYFQVLSITVIQDFALQCCLFSLFALNPWPDWIKQTCPIPMKVYVKPFHLIPLLSFLVILSRNQGLLPSFFWVEILPFFLGQTFCACLLFPNSSSAWSCIPYSVSNPAQRK